MPYPEHIKARARELDPDCWHSYSGCTYDIKRNLDARRSAALKQACSEHDYTLPGYMDVDLKAFLRELTTLGEYDETSMDSGCSDVRQRAREFLIRMGESVDEVQL